VVRFASENFVSVKVDIQARPDIFDRKVGGRGGLGTCVLDGTGDIVSVLPEYADAERFLDFLRRAVRNYPGLRSARSSQASRPTIPSD
jgi:hypothetical protein